MANTATWTTPWYSDTDANFQAWGSELSAMFASVGLVQTADTGQIDWTTVSISGYPGIVGYEIWTFSDAAQTSNPVFFKIEYGASSAGNPEMYITFGSASNGTGSLITNYGVRFQFANGTTNPATAYPSYLCFNPTYGFLGLAFKIGGMYSSSTAGCGFAVSRTCDTSGAVTTDGWSAYFINAGNPNQTFFWFINPHVPQQFPAANGQNVTGGYYGCWPASQGSSFAGGALQVVPTFQMQPAVQTNPNMCVGILLEIPIGNQFSLNIVGLTPRNFISTGQPFGSLIYESGGLGYTEYTTCMLWE